MAKEIKYTHEENEYIKTDIAKGATPGELTELFYLSKTYNLDIMTKQLMFVKGKTGKAQIYPGRDGFLQIAHESGQFNGMEMGTKGSLETNDLTGFCKVFRKDMEHSFYSEVDYNEYASQWGLWKTKPKTMITKVAESQTLRKAFNICGMYSPEEMQFDDKEIVSKTDDKKDDKTDDKKGIIKIKKIGDKMSIAEKQLLRAMANSKGYNTNESIKEYALSNFKVDDLNNITSQVCKDITESLRGEQSITVNQQLNLQKVERDFKENEKNKEKQKPEITSSLKYRNRYSKR